MEKERQYRELANDQIRQMVDSEQLFMSWRETQGEFLHGYEGSYKGSMKWKRRSSGEYLYRILNGVEKSLGARSAETERIKADYMRARNRLRDRLKSQEQKLRQMARLNRAMRLGRVPNIAADILLKLDEQGLLGSHLVVVGTNALFAYEAKAGVHIDSEVLATEDVDFLFDARRHLKLVSADIKRNGLMGLLKEVDESFTRSKQSFRASNRDGYLVDLIRPQDVNEIRSKFKESISDIDDDLIASPIEGLEWLLHAPRFEQVAIATNGRPVLISTIDPRVYALHKVWVARTAQLRGAKKRRDLEQARIVARIAEDQLGLHFKDKSLTAFPAKLLKDGREILEIST
jgi:hypothetical protein